jgi:two-component system chemotaxis sensor kinase CheA
MKDAIEQSIESIEEKILRLEDGKPSPALIGEVLASLGLTKLKLSSAQLTAMFDMLADGIQKMTPEIVSALLSICESHKRLFHAMAGDIDDRAERIREKKAEAAAQGVDLDRIDDEHGEPVEADAPEQGAAAGEDGKEKSPGEAEIEQADTSGPAQKQQAQQGKESISSIRVTTSKLDKLIDHVGKLMVIYAVIAQNSNLDSATVSGLKEMDSVIDRIKTEVEKIRLVPLKQIFIPIHRLVKSLIQKVNKKIRFEVRGDDLELDKQIVEHINEPLVHLLRNAVDHGLESPEERLAAGKDETGVLMLKAWRKGEHAYLRVEDDGRGLNPEKIRAKALERGMITGEEELSDHEIYQFIMKSGFSTAEKVTDISGRGVGMDAVVNTIRDRLGGDVTIESEPGKGTAFTVSIPLSQSMSEGIVDALVAREGEEVFILPSKNVVEVYSITDKDVADLHDGREVIDVRGEMHTLIRLGRVFGLASGNGSGDSAAFRQAVVIQIGSKRAALMVDEVLRKQQVVVTGFTVPITDIYQLPILGYGLMGEEDALVLDLERLLDNAEAGEASI